MKKGNGKENGMKRMVISRGLFPGGSEKERSNIQKVRYLDFNEMQSVTNTGMVMLINQIRLSLEMGIEIRMWNAPGNLKRLLRMTGLEDIVNNE